MALEDIVAVQTSLGLAVPSLVLAVPLWLAVLIVGRLGFGSIASGFLEAFQPAITILISCVVIGIVFEEWHSFLLL